ncbi:MAG: nuclear transport factor 2 family protein [Verrucomicrobia bacterium]|nr:MAG: nuclear transport factor 2 family protein [Verrucomicrobiota bacterium]
MGRALFIAVLVLTVAPMGEGQKQSARGSHQTSVEEVIRKLDNERIQAQIHADATALDRIYAADFIGVGPSGRVRTKPQVILDFTSGDLKFQSIITDDVQVRVYGNTAVETGRSIMNGQDKGQTVPRDTRFTRVLGKAARALAVGCQPLLVPDYATISSHTKCLTNRWSQPLAVVMSTFDFMKQFSMFATLAPASDGSAPSR